MDFLTPTSELEAVNAMLASIGEAPVNSITDTGLAEVDEASTQLRLTSRRCQSRGWYWNTDIEMKLLRDASNSNNIAVPANALKVTPSGCDSDTIAVLRGARLYDPKGHTYVFTKDVVCDVVSMLDFSELPEPARQFIFLSAARTFQQGKVGSDTLTGFEEKDEVRAWAALISDEADKANYNILTGNADVSQAWSNRWV